MPFLLTGGLDHPVGDRADLAGALGHRDEVGRLHQAAHGIVPADQRLDAHDRARIQGHDRLIVEHQLAALDRPPQAAGDGQTGRWPRRSRARAVVELSRPTCLARYISMSACFSRSSPAVASNGYSAIPTLADTNTSTPSSSAGRDTIERIREAVSSATERTMLGSSSPGIESNTKKLVTAQPGDDVLLPDRLAQPSGQHSQEIVADGVAEAVVDQFEVVDVHEQHRRRRAGASGLGQVALAAARRTSAGWADR